MNSCLSVTVGVLIALQAGLPLLAQAIDQAAPTVTLQLEADLPQELPTVFEATTSSRTERVFQVRLPGFSPAEMLAQRDSLSSRAWFIGSLQEPGKQSHAGTYSATARQAADQVVTIRTVENGLQVLDAGRAVLTYNTKPQSHEGKFTRNGFVHPVNDLDGQPLTEAFPADHRHHHGVFWAWHQLWVGAQRAGDPWIAKDFLARLQQVEVIDQGPVFAALRARLHWTSPKIVDEQGEPRAIVEETTTIRVFHATPQSQLVDFEIKLVPLVSDVRLGGAENERGYSGFTVRVRPPREMAIFAEAGALARDAVGTRSRWADVTGHFSDQNRLSGIAILSHRQLPQFPPAWLLRFYGMQNVVYPGREPVGLSKTTPLVLRHRLVIHRGDAKSARIADHQRVFESKGG